VDAIGLFLSTTVLVFILCVGVYIINVDFSHACDSVVDNYSTYQQTSVYIVVYLNG